MANKLIELGSALYPEDTLSKTALTFHADIAYEEWARIGSQLVGLQNSSLFWLGDWINHGRKAFGAKYKAALEALPNYRYQSLVNIAYTCSRVPPSRRKESLLFTHHTEVASMKPIEQERWLSIAVEEKLDTVAMRQRIRASAEFAHERSGSASFNIVRWAREGVKWFEREYAAIQDDPERRRLLKRDLQAIVDIHTRL